MPRRRNKPAPLSPPPIIWPDACLSVWLQRVRRLKRLPIPSTWKRATSTRYRVPLTGNENILLSLKVHESPCAGSVLWLWWTVLVNVVYRNTTAGNLNEIFLYGNTAGMGFAALCQQFKAHLIWKVESEDPRRLKTSLDAPSFSMKSVRSFNP